MKAEAPRREVPFKAAPRDLKREIKQRAAAADAANFLNAVRATLEPKAPAALRREMITSWPTEDQSSSTPLQQCN